ncbi:MAG: hypothetical protein M3Y54_05125 [Bacteroidota bacterium]|nr:hypothetical protein [Bacteroidota bacterium]
MDLIICGIGILLYTCFFLYLFIAFSGTLDTYHTKQELIDNYTNRRAQIMELRSYFNSIVPNNKRVEIEFESDTKLFRFGVSPIDPATREVIYPLFLEWDLKTSSSKVDSAITSIGWTQQNLRTLKQKLDKADCIGIESGEPTKIGWQRSGMGRYSYNVFERPISDSLKNQYKSSCTHIFYNNELVLEYGGGAIGPDCFPKD